MKVREAAGAAGSGRLTADNRAARGSGASFLDTARGAEDKNVLEKLQKMALEIAAQGSKLADRVDIRELRIYKKLIADFMEEAVGKSRKFSKQSFLDRRGRHKVYAVIKKVNAELDDLTQEVLREEKDTIRILKKLDDIKGLILDILM